MLFPQKRHVLVRPTLCVGHSQVELLGTDFCYHSSVRPDIVLCISGKGEKVSGGGSWIPTEVGN